MGLPGGRPGDAAGEGLGDGFDHADRLASSRRSWLDAYVDRDPSYPGETFARVGRDGSLIDDRKSFYGKNMLHAHEHALVICLHGRAIEGRPPTHCPGSRASR